MSKRIVVTSCIAVLAGVMAPAQAADLDEIIYAKELRETKTVEIGSGWYLRGDLGYQVNKKYGSTVANATSPFQGLVPFTPSGALSQNNDFASMTVNIGAGYHLNDLFRVDFNLAAVGQNAFGQDGTFTGGCGGTRTITTTNYVGGVPVVPSTTTSSVSSVNCNGSISVDNAMYLGMLNGYVDLGTFAGFTPYIGAGVGLAYTKQTARADGRCQGSQTVSGVTGVSQTTNTFVCNNQTSFASPAVDVSLLNYKADQWSIAYSLNAGVGYRITKNMTLDLGYQFTSAPNAQYADFSGGTFSQKKGVDIHEVRFGLRYDLW